MGWQRESELCYWDRMNGFVVRLCPWLANPSRTSPFTPPSLESTLAEGPTDWKCSESLFFSKVHVWPGTKYPSTNLPLDSCGLVWAEATGQLREGKILLWTGIRPPFSVVMTLPAFFYAALQIFKSCCRSSMGLFSPLRCSAIHRSCSRPRLFGVVTCSWIGGVPSQRFRVRFWALEGDILGGLPPKGCSCSEFVHADGTDPEPGWHHCERTL